MTFFGFTIARADKGPAYKIVSTPHREPWVFTVYERGLLWGWNELDYWKTLEECIRTVQQDVSRNKPEVIHSYYDDDGGLVS